jgi:hypothetical protein
MDALAARIVTEYSLPVACVEHAQHPHHLLHLGLSKAKLRALQFCLVKRPVVMQVFRCKVHYAAQAAGARVCLTVALSRRTAVRRYDCPFAPAATTDHAARSTAVTMLESGYHVPSRRELAT